MKNLILEPHKYIFYLVAAYGVAFAILTILCLVSWYQLNSVRRKYTQLTEK